MPDHQNEQKKAVLQALLNGYRPPDADLAAHVLVVAQMGWMETAWREHPDWTAEQIVREVTDETTKVQARLAGHRLGLFEDPADINALLKGFAAEPGAPGSIIGGMGEAIWGLQAVQNQINQVYAYNATVQRFDFLQKFGEQGIEDGALQSFLQVLVEPRGVRAAAMLFPELLRGLVAADGTVDLTPGVMIQNNPEFFGDVMLRAIQPDGSLKLNLDELRMEYATTMQGVSGSVPAACQGLSQITPNLSDVNAFLKNPGAQAAARTISQSLSAQWADPIRKAEQGIWVLSTFIGLLDPKAAADIQRAGSAAIRVAQAGLQLVDAVSKIASVGLSLGTAAATGNFIGAAMSLIGLFAEAGPTVDQMILEEVQRVREDIENLRQEMQEGFARISRQIGQVYKGIMDELAHINIQLGRLEVSVEDARTRLAEQQVTLLRVAMNLRDYFETAERQDLKKSIITYLGRRKLGAPLELDDFQEAAGAFRQYAISAAFDSIEQPVEGRGTGYRDLASELEGPVDDNVSFIDSVLIGLGYGSFLDGRKAPNAIRWSLAANAYAQLESEWPEHAVASSPQDHGKGLRDEVRSAGRMLSNGLSKLTSNPEMLPNVISDYGEAVSELGRRLDALQSDWQVELRKRLMRDLDEPVIGINLWAPLASALEDRNAYNAPLRGTMTHHSNSAAPPYAAPFAPSIWEATPWEPLTADWLRAFHLELTYEPLLSKRIIHHKGVPGRVDDWDQYVVAFHVIVRVLGPSGVEVAAVKVHSDSTWSSKDGWPVTPDPDTLMRGEWNQGADDPEHSLYVRLEQNTQGKVTIEYSDTGPARAKAAEAARPVVDGYRAAFSAWLCDQLRPGGLAQREAEAVDGAKALIVSLVSLALEQERRGDDVLVALLDGEPQSRGGVALPDSGRIMMMLLDRDTGEAPPKFEDWLGEVTTVATETLLTRVSEWQQVIADGSWQEHYGRVEDALLKLDLAESMVLRWVKTP